MRARVCVCACVQDGGVSNQCPSSPKWQAIQSDNESTKNGQFRAQHLGWPYNMHAFNVHLDVHLVEHHVGQRSLLVALLSAI